MSCLAVCGGGAACGGFAMVMGSGRQWCCTVSFPLILVCEVWCRWAAGGPGWVLGEDQVIKECHSWWSETTRQSSVGLRWRRAGREVVGRHEIRCHVTS